MIFEYFAAFRQSLVRQDLLVASLFNFESLSADTFIEIFKRFAMGLLIVTGLSIIYMVSTLFWEIIYYFYSCIRCCRKKKRPPVKNENLRMIIYLCLMGFMWALMLGAAATHYFAYVKLDRGITNTVGNLEKLLTTVDDTFKNVPQKLQMSNAFISPFLALPVVNIMRKNQSLSVTLVDLQDLLNRAQGAVPAPPPALVEAANFFKSMLEAGLDVEKIILNPSAQVSEATLTKITQYLVPKSIVEEHAFSTKDNFLGKFELPTKKIIDPAKKYSKMATSYLFPFVMGEIGIVVFVFVLFLILVLTRRFRGLLACWALLVNFVIIFLLLHVILLQVSTVLGTTCRAFNVDNKNRKEAMGIVDLGGVKWTPNNFKRLLMSCERKDNIIEGLYFAFDLDGDDPKKIFSDKISLNYPERTADIIIKSGERQQKVKLDDELMFGGVGKQIILDAYRAGSTVTGQPFHQEAFKFLKGKLPSATGLSSDSNALHNYINQRCAVSSPWSDVARVKHTDNVPWIKKGSDASEAFTHHGMMQAFRCKPLADAVRETTDILCGDLLQGLDGFTTVHMVFGWVGFFLLVFMMLFRSKRFFKVDKTKKEDGPDGDADLETGPVEIRPEGRRRRRKVQPENAANQIQNKPLDLVTEVRSNIEKQSYAADQKDPGLYSSAKTVQAPTHDPPPMFEQSETPRYPADSKNPFLYEMNDVTPSPAAMGLAKSTTVVDDENMPSDSAYVDSSHENLYSELSTAENEEAADITMEPIQSSPEDSEEAPVGRNESSGMLPSYSDEE